VRRAYAEALRYELVSNDEQMDVLELREQPLLNWSSANAGALYGSVLLWTAEGRPAAVASIYRWYVDRQEFQAEFKSLSTRPLVGTREEQLVWDAQPSDITNQPLGDEGPPAATAAIRLRQMRDIARRFSAKIVHPNEGTSTLRLLTQPVYRYEEMPEGVLDGGLFAFVQGTDPEVFLLIEAEQSADGPRWTYAAARMNMFQLHLALDEKEVWKANQLSWSEANSRNGPYIIRLLEY
jgi:hypothetical protein